MGRVRIMDRLMPLADFRAMSPPRPEGFRTVFHRWLRGLQADPVPAQMSHAFHFRMMCIGASRPGT
jgi:hypothetical protein